MISKIILYISSIHWLFFVFFVTILYSITWVYYNFCFSMIKYYIFYSVILYINFLFHIILTKVEVYHIIYIFFLHSYNIIKMLTVVTKWQKFNLFLIQFFFFHFYIILYYIFCICIKCYTYIYSLQTYIENEICSVWQGLTGKFLPRTLH